MYLSAGEFQAWLRVTLSFCGMFFSEFAVAVVSLPKRVLASAEAGETWEGV